MKKLFSLFLTLNLLLLVNPAQSQHEQVIVDSLLKQLSLAKEDTSKVDLLVDICFYSASNDPDLGIKYGKMGIELAEKLQYQMGIANAYRNVGTCYSTKTIIPQAIDHYFKSLKMFEQIGDKMGIGKVSLSIGQLYSNQLDFQNAEKYFTLAMKQFEGTGNKNAISTAYNNLGILYSRKKDFPKAIDYFTRSLKIKEEMGNKKGVESSISNLAQVYSEQGNFGKALENYFAALEINNETGNRSYRAVQLSSIGNVFFYSVKEQDNATLQKYFSGNKTMALKKAKLYIDSAIVIYTELGNLSDLHPYYKSLSEIQELLGDTKGSLESYKKYVAGKDSVFNQENTRKTLEMQLQFEYGKKEIADSVRAEEGKKVIVAQLEEAKTKEYSLYGGLALMVIFGGFMFNRFKVTQKQKNIIELKEKETQKQKAIIEQKQKEILDSINYAQRIQQSQLPTEHYINRNLSRLGKKRN